MLLTLSSFVHWKNRSVSLSVTAKILFTPTRGSWLSLGVPSISPLSFPNAITLRSPLTMIFSLFLSDMVLGGAIGVWGSTSDASWVDCQMFSNWGVLLLRNIQKGLEVTSICLHLAQGLQLKKMVLAGFGKSRYDHGIYVVKGTLGLNFGLETASHVKCYVSTQDVGLQTKFRNDRCSSWDPRNVGDTHIESVDWCVVAYVVNLLTKFMTIGAVDVTDTQTKHTEYNTS